MSNAVHRRKPSGKRLTVFVFLAAGVLVSLSMLFKWGQGNQVRANELAETGTAMMNEASLLSTAQAEAQRQFQVAFARQLAAQAQSVLEVQEADPETALLLAAQSMRVFPMGDASQVLLDHPLAYPIFKLKHAAPVKSVAFSPDGKHIASGGQDGTIRILKASTGEEVSRMTHGKDVTTVGFSPDSRYLLSGGCDELEVRTYTCLQGSARVWDALTGREVTRVTQESRVRFAVFSPDGNFVLSGGCARFYGNELPCPQDILQLWETSTGKEISQIAHGQYVSALAFSLTGEQIVSGGCDAVAPNTQCNQASVRVWNSFTGKEIARIPYEQDVTSVAIRANGMIAAASRDGTARVWETATGNEIARMNHGSAVSAVLFSLRDRNVISADDNGSIRVWNIDTGAEAARMQHRYGVTALVLSRDGKYVAAASRDRTARVWEFSTGKETARMPHGGFVNALAFSPDGKIVVSGSEDNTLRAWKSRSGNDFARDWRTNYARVVAFSPDGKHAVSGSEDGNAYLWEIATGNFMHSLSQDTMVSPGTPVLFAAFHPDGERVILGGPNRRIYIWEPFTDKVAEVLAGFDGQYMALSSDGRYLAGAGFGSIAVWDIEARKGIADIPYDEAAYSLAMSTDGRYVIAGSLGHTIRVWEVATGREVSRLVEDSYVSAVAMSPDGSTIAAAGYFPGFRIWNITTGQRIAQVTTEDGIMSIAFSPDGDYMITGGGSTARVWDAHTWQEITRVAHPNVRSVAFSPDGRYALSGSYFDTVRMWNWRPEELLAGACARVTRNLTWLEWQQYVGNALPYQATCPDFPIEQDPAAILLAMPTGTPTPTSTPAGGLFPTP